MANIQEHKDVYSKMEESIKRAEEVLTHPDQHSAYLIRVYIRFLWDLHTMGYYRSAMLNEIVHRIGWRNL